LYVSLQQFGLIGTGITLGMILIQNKQHLVLEDRRRWEKMGEDGRRWEKMGEDVQVDFGFFK